MKQMGCESETTDLVDQTQLPILCGLPDDIALFCLARVPRKYHIILKCVSKRWKDLVCSEEWHAYRKKNKLDESWIYALCKDKFEQICCYVLDPTSSRRCWRLLKKLPPQSVKRKGMGFEVLGKRLYLLGGCGWSEDATNKVYCYDASTDIWTEAAPLSSARCYFASEVLNGKIYAIGGLCSNSSDPHSWDTYDALSNNSEFHMDLNIMPDVEDSFVMDGKIYIRCIPSTVGSQSRALVFEPSSCTWKEADVEIAAGWRGPAVVVNGNLNVLDQSSGTRLMMWHKGTREWIPIGRLSSMLTRPPCKLVTIGSSIFIIGKGLSTVIIDVGNAGNLEGVMVSSSIPKLTSDEYVLSCKCLSI